MAEIIKEVKRGYLKWYDEDGEFHKEPLFKHADMMAKATPAQRLQAEEVRRGLLEGERELAEDLADSEEDIEKTLKALKAAPEEVVFASELDTNEKGDPIPKASEPLSSTDFADVDGNRD